MAAVAPTKTAEATHLLKYNTWVLKVPIHCLGCKREVKKLLQRIDGVYSTTVDSQQQKVTVSGNIDSETLVKKLLKTGKHAEIWSEKTNEKTPKNEKQNEPKSGQIKDQKTPKNEPKLNNSIKPNNAKEMKSDKKSNQTPETPANSGGSGNGGKIKKGKEKNGNCGSIPNGGPASTGSLNANQGKFQGVNQVNISPSFEQFDSILPNQGPTTVHVMNYNAAYPSKLGYGISYQVPTSPYISYNSTNDPFENYQVKGDAFNSLSIFSDEDPNGCFIM